LPSLDWIQKGRRAQAPFAPLSIRSWTYGIELLENNDISLQDFNFLERYLVVEAFKRLHQIGPSFVLLNFEIKLNCYDLKKGVSVVI